MPHHANSTSFQKGRTTWNETPCVKRTCVECGTEFEVREASTHIRACKYCSQACQRKSRKTQSKYHDLLELKAAGFTTKELATYYGVSTITITSALNRYGYRTPEGESYSARRKRIIRLKQQTCVICGFDRYVELAHIVPASEGGVFEEGNTVTLCPNHHRLFDQGRLTENEKAQLARSIRCLPQSRKSSSA